MRRHGLQHPHSLAAMFLLSAIAPGQDASGIVLGFDGKPVAGAVVAARAHANGPTSGIEVLTDAEGRFALHCAAALTELRVQLEGVTRSVQLANGNARDTQASFADAAHFTLRGQVIAPDGRPLAAIDLLCRTARGGALVTVTTNPMGAFAVRLDQPVCEVVVDPMGWQHVEAGPFVRDHELTVDLRRQGDAWFVLQGRVFDDDGPGADELVRAHLDGERIVRVRTRADGGYSIWANRPVATLEAVRTVPIVRRGPFTATTTALDLDEREHGLVLVVGTFCTKAGAPLAHAWIFGVDADGPPPKGVAPNGITDSQGRFRVLLPRCTPRVWAWSEGTDSGGSAAIPADRSPIDVRAQ